MPNNDEYIYNSAFYHHIQNYNYTCYLSSTIPHFQAEDSGKTKKKTIYMKNKTGLQGAIGQIQKHKTFQIKLLNHYTNNSNHNQIQLHKHTN